MGWWRWFWWIGRLEERWECVCSPSSGVVDDDDDSNNNNNRRTCGRLGWWLGDRLCERDQYDDRRTSGRLGWWLGYRTRKRVQ